MEKNLDVGSKWPKERLIFLCEDLNISATEAEIQKAIKSYKRHSPGKDLRGLCRSMAKDVRPRGSRRDTEDEMIFFIVDLARKGKI